MRSNIRCNARLGRSAACKPSKMARNAARASFFEGGNSVRSVVHAAANARNGSACNTAYNCSSNFSPKPRVGVLMMRKSEARSKGLTINFK